jgi:hypothetical protein
VLRLAGIDDQPLGERRKPMVNTSLVHHLADLFEVNQRPFSVNTDLAPLTFPRARSN